MKLPHGEQAFIDLAKLRDYSLSGSHPEGKHKARVFAATLGLDHRDADWLRDALLSAAITQECRMGIQTDFGQRFVVDFQVQRGVLEARIRSAWIIRTNENFPRLTTCYVL